MSSAPHFLVPSEAILPLFAGFDVGGTNVKLGIADAQGRALGRSVIPTEADRGPSDAAERMAAALDRLLAEIGAAGSEVVRVGLATPGTMDIPSGMLLTPGNLPAWHHVPIRDLVSAACRLPVTFANDANAAAYGHSSRSMVMFTLGTGVGGGVVADGRLIVGSHSAGGELGHILIDSRSDAPLNSLGVRGTLEGHCGSYAVVRRAQEHLAAGDASSVRKRLSDGEELTPLLLAQEAEAGDQLALDVVLTTARYLALGVVSAVHTIDPESVVLGGAMTFGGAGHVLGERFLAHVRREAYERMFQHMRDRVRIDFATLGSDAGYLGAAGLACSEHCACA